MFGIFPYNPFDRKRESLSEVESGSHAAPSAKQLGRLVKGVTARKAKGLPYHQNSPLVASVREDQFTGSGTFGVCASAAWAWKAFNAAAARNTASESRLA